MPEPRSTFAPVLALGLAGATIAAVAASKPWVVDTSLPAGSDPLGLVADAGEMPLALALSLVVLACWGVLLVTRGVVRRVVAGLALVAAVGLAVAVVVGLFTLPDQVQQAFPDGFRRTTDTDVIEQTAWYWAAAVGALLSVVATALAVRWVGHWPEMGSRYDAPGGAVAQTPPEETSSLDLWKSIDEGRDPTV
ncbi:Trp biosynthesis-associated membrane protein [Nocardioides sp.]|uniref:Trp biosynthesis-associated membrane protein n=1 Tax=Nocardioides sp. TaxID=35761 RepID=UPI002D7FFD08|nr:Trp biosynthesis-associated membrane protein [Nocardioides sp.]HET8960139.1 Trp biosynthesis-associated membrane protein [Nocardioides sp.]